MKVIVRVVNVVSRRRTGSQMCEWLVLCLSWRVREVESEVE